MILVDVPAGYWSIIALNRKNAFKSILVSIITVLIGVILYNLFFKTTSIENFAVQLNSGNLFGNYINTQIANETVVGEYTCNLSDTYRIESIVVGGVENTTRYVISYSNSNNGQRFAMDEKTGNQTILSPVNSAGDKIYCSTLKFKFTNKDGSPYSSTSTPTIKIYGMRLGDYDLDYYTNEAAGNRTFSSNGASKTTNLPADIDKIDDSIIKHYFQISRDSTEPVNRLIKGVNYSISDHDQLPIQITIQYANTISKTIYYVSNKESMDEQIFTLGEYSGTIYFSVPILANLLIFKVKSKSNKFNSGNTTLIGKNPDDVEINTYSIPEYVRKNIYTSKCPSVDIIANNQNLTQKLCDDLENQDKLRMEQIKLEKEKQYLIKLKKQDEEISNLQEQITAIENKRKNRDAVLDNLKLAQLQKQREEAVELRDLASEQLAGQNSRSLNLDINLVQEV